MQKVSIAKSFLFVFDIYIFYSQFSLALIKSFIYNVVRGDSMKNIILIPNVARDKDYKYTKKIINIIGSHANVFLSKEHSDIGSGASFIDNDKLFCSGDVVIALGGDGTILTAVSEVSRHNLPILGINLGRLGFLAEIEPDCMSHAIEQLLTGQYKIEERIMIKADIHREGKVIKTFHALNDIVVARAAFSRLLGLRSSIDSHLLDSFVADGVILATSTGSTAYSLSAGGPILDPSLEAMIITPVCPHTMHTRPMVVPFSKELIIELEPGHDDEGAFVSADGKRGINLKPNDKVVASKSPFITKLIKITDTTFYDTIRQKINERGVAK